MYKVKIHLMDGLLQNVIQRFNHPMYQIAREDNHKHSIPIITLFQLLFGLNSCFFVCQKNVF